MLYTQVCRCHRLHWCRYWWWWWFWSVHWSINLCHHHRHFVGHHWHLKILLPSDNEKVWERFSSEHMYICMRKEGGRWGEEIHWNMVKFTYFLYQPANQPTKSKRANKQTNTRAYTQMGLQWISSGAHLIIHPAGELFEGPQVCRCGALSATGPLLLLRLLPYDDWSLRGSQIGIYGSLANFVAH